MGKSHSPKIFIFSYIYYNCECTDSVHNKRIPALMALAGEKEKIMYKIIGFKNDEVKVIGFVESEEKAKKACKYLNIKAFLKRSDISYEYELEYYSFPIIPKYLHACAVVHKYPAFASWVEFKESTCKELKITIGQNIDIVDGMKVPIDDFKNLHHLECKVFELIYRYRKGLPIDQ